ncbi:hypothetical protein [Seonamhaeicola sp.]|uniref:helix-turn-helix and ligand-binding sensor domain-containing protein n=1 Tax=Seonamhaeicola sp. TaxID=1912245 RepID=UPI0026295C56|nr:hypothetical protein [Seonamhaeicola sp.]
MILPCLSYGQVFYPEIDNYGITEYQADNQNWGIDVSNDGVVYVANNKGLLVYNGQSWELYQLPNKTVVRSVFVYGNKIFTGSYEEFGYWQKDALGTYNYTSLLHLFDKEHEFKSAEFWKITNYKEDILFRSFEGFYVYSGNKIDYIENSGFVYDIATHEDKILLANKIMGLQELRNEKLLAYSPTGQDEGLRGTGNIAAFEGLLFFYDSNNGAFLYNLEKRIPLTEKINAQLKEFVINKIEFINRDTIAFGTIKNGILIYNINSGNIEYLNKESGLQNNTVLGLKYLNGNLWVALDNGISKIDLKTPFLYYSDDSGTLGTVHDIVYFNSQYYLASNTGVYTFSENDEIQFIRNSEGVAWDLEVVGDDLIVGHNKGTFLVREDQAIPINFESGGVYSNTELPNQKNSFLQGTYLGVNLLVKKGDNWYSQLVKNISFPVNNVVFESNDIIWISHPNKGVYRVKLDKAYSKALSMTDFDDYKGFSRFKSTITSLDGAKNILFNNSGEWFTYYKEEDSLGPYKRFQEFNNKRIIGQNEYENWFLDDKVLSYLDKDFKEVFIVNIPEVKRRLVSGFEKVIVKNDSIRIMNLNDGLAVFNVNVLKNRVQKSYDIPPVIAKIYSLENHFPINDSILKIPYKDGRRLTLEVSSPNLYGNRHAYRLSGKYNQQGVIEGGDLILQNLSYGEYSLSLKNDRFDRNYIKTTELKLIILPPWYLSGSMKSIYMLFFLAIIYVIYKLNKIKVQKEHMKLKQEYAEDVKAKIRKLEKENYEKEIRTKKRELLNSTSTIIQKNEALMVLTNELKRLKEVSPNKARTNKVLDLTNSFFNNKDDWRLFEINFNALNDNFLKRLAKDYPKLTTKDLRLCAYIKTGLTTKQIAPLMGITLKGTEIQRYRLRKKMDIESGKSLSEFLVSY